MKIGLSPAGFVDKETGKFHAIGLPKMWRKAE